MRIVAYNAWGTSLVSDPQTQIASATPTVNAVTPSSVSKAAADITEFTLTISGENLVSGLSVVLRKEGEDDIAASSATTERLDQAVCTFDLSAAASGDWSVVVTNPGGFSAEWASVAVSEWFGIKDIGAVNSSGGFLLSTAGDHLYIVYASGEGIRLVKSNDRGESFTIDSPITIYSGGGFYADTIDLFSSGNNV